MICDLFPHHDTLTIRFVIIQQLTCWTLIIQLLSCWIVTMPSWLTRSPQSLGPNILVDHYWSNSLKLRVEGLRQWELFSKHVCAVDKLHKQLPLVFQVCVEEKMSTFHKLEILHIKTRMASWACSRRQCQVRCWHFFHNNSSTFSLWYQCVDAYAVHQHMLMHMLCIVVGHGFWNVFCKAECLAATFWEATLRLIRGYGLTDSDSESEHKVTN